MPVNQVTPPPLSAEAPPQLGPQQENVRRPPNNRAHPPIYPFDSNVYRIIKNWYPLRFKLNFPKKSVLNAAEQKEYLMLHAKFHQKVSLKCF